MAPNPRDEAVLSKVRSNVRPPSEGYGFRIAHGLWIEGLGRIAGPRLVLGPRKICIGPACRYSE
eukprot:183117-Alexandrium_andersonii.AAC.1